MEAMTLPMTFGISDLPEIFSDVEPIPQDDGPDPVCAIAYTQSFITAHDYMRAVFQSGEMSGRFITTMNLLSDVVFRTLIEDVVLRVPADLTK